MKTDDSGLPRSASDPAPESETLSELVRRLAGALDVRHAVVTERLTPRGLLRPLAFWSRERFIPFPDYDPAETPCGRVLADGSYFCPEGLRELFPEDLDLVDLSATSYRGAALRETSGEVLGHVGVLDDEPMEDSPVARTILDAYALAAASEVRRIHAERSLGASANRLFALVEAIPDPVMFKDGEGRWLAVNSAGVELFDLNDVDWKGKTNLELAELMPQLATAFRAGAESDQRAWERGEAIEDEEVVQGARGPFRVYMVHKVPLFEPGGARRGIVVVGRDVTRRRRAERELGSSDQRFRMIGESLPGVVHSYVVRPDDTRKMLYCSSGTIQLFGPEAASVFERDIDRFRRDHYHPDDRVLAIEEGRRTLEEAKTYDHEYRVLTDDDYKWIRHIARAIPQDDGSFLSHGIIIDVTEQKEAEGRLRRYADALMTANQALHLAQSVSEAADRAERRAEEKATERGGEAGSADGHHPDVGGE